MTTPELDVPDEAPDPELIGEAVTVAMDRYSLDPSTAGELVGLMIETWNLPGDLLHQVSRAAAEAGYQLDPYQFIADMNRALRGRT